MIHREDQLPSQERNVVMASLTQTSFTQTDDDDSDVLILLKSGISSLFFHFLIYRGFTLSAAYERCFLSEDGDELALTIPDMLVVCVTVNRYVCFCLH